MNRPADWDRKRIGEFAEKVQDGTHFSPKSKDGPYRYLTSKNIRMGRLDLGDSGWISEAEHRGIYRRCDPRRGDVLLTKDGANTGNVVVNPLDEEFSLLSSVAMIRCDEARSSGRYLYHLLASSSGRQQMEAAMAGNAISRLTLRKIVDLVVDVPPLEEQRRIAEILDAIDETIQATERVIAKLRAELNGLTDELVGSRLRVGAPTCPLGEMLQLRIDYRGRTPKKLGMDWGNGQIPALSANNVQMGSIDLDRECYLGSQLLYERWMTRGDTAKGDLVITLEAPLGNVARIPDDRRYILSQRVVLLRFDSSFLLNDFGFWLLRSKPLQSEMRRRSTGTTATGIRRAELERIALPLVDLGEQARAAAALDACERNLNCELDALRKLWATRAGLADDLLTGRVRTAAA